MLKVSMSTLNEVDVITYIVDTTEEIGKLDSEIIEKLKLNTILSKKINRRTIMTELSSKVIFIDKRKTSMRLANAEWEAIDSICKRENIKRNNLLEMINARKDAKMGLTCSVRLFSLIYYYRLLTKEPMPRAGSSADASSPIFEAIKGII